LLLLSGAKQKIMLIFIRFRITKLRGVSSLGLAVRY